MNGKTKENIAFAKLFKDQMINQNCLLMAGKYDNFKSANTDIVPIDDIKLASYHIQQLMSEIGEVLDADKRWKNFRNDKYDKDAKLEELADCFIVLMNVAMFSGFDGFQMQDAIVKKLNVFSERIEKENAK